MIFSWQGTTDVRIPGLDEIPEDDVAWSASHAHAYVRVKPASSEASRHPENMWTDDSGEVFELICVGPRGNMRWPFPAASDLMRSVHPEIERQLNCRPWIATEPDGNGGRKPT